MTKFQRTKKKLGMTILHYMCMFITFSDPEFGELWDGFLYKLRICRAIGLKKSFKENKNLVYTQTYHTFCHH